VHLLAWALVGVALYLVGVAIDHHGLRMAVKPLPVLALMAWTWRARPDRVGRLVVAALGLGLAGDMLLEAGGSTFLLGLIAFLVGHVVYAAAFTADARPARWGLAAPWAAYTAAIYVVLGPLLGDMAGPVVAYMVAISIMAWRASARAASLGGPALWGVIGAALFVFSDTLIALDRFGEPIEGVRPAIILTYWLAQAALAASVWRADGV